jgi:hypothetical protein
MAEDDIESYWEGIRPVREPEPEPRRKVHPHAARFRESFVGTDEQWDLRAIDIQRAGRVNDPRSFTMDEIRGDCEERSLAFMRHALITELGHEPTNREVIRTLQQYVTVPETQEELEALVHRGDRVDETPAGGLPGTREEWDRLVATLESPTLTPDLIEIPQGLRSVNQRLQEVLGRDPNMREVLAGIQRERELDRPLSVTEINDLLLELSDLELREQTYSSESSFLTSICQRLFQELGRSPTSDELREAFLAQGGTAEQMMEGVRQALRNRSASSPTDPSVLERQPIASYFPSWTPPGSSEFFDRQAEYNQLVAAAGLPEGSITVERGDPDLGRLGELEELANRLETVVANQRENLGVFTRPTEPAVPLTLPSSRTPMGGVSLDDYNNNHPLSRLNEDLTALGFPPESISIERSIEGGTSLTIHMPVTMQTQLTGPGHSSVTFSNG